MGTDNTQFRQRFRVWRIKVREGNYDFCDTLNPGGLVDHRQPTEYLCLISRDPYMSKMATLAHTYILIKMYILYKKELIYNYPKLGLLPRFLQNT